MKKKIYRNLKATLIVGASCTILSGCIFPTKFLEGEKSIHVDYEKIQNALLCHVIEAWKIEYDYHNRRIASDGTNWFTQIQLVHTRSGSIGSGNTGISVDTTGNWRNVISTGVTPSVSNAYELTANTKTNIPLGVFTDDSIKKNPSLSKNLVVDTKNIADCNDNKYVNVSHLGIIKQFENYIKGFEPEQQDGSRRYTDLEFDETARLVASVGGEFAYNLVPQSALFTPSLGYTDQILIEVDVNRRELYPEIEDDTLEVEITNASLNVNGRIHISNAQELACRINYPLNAVGGKDREGFAKCINNGASAARPVRQSQTTRPIKPRVTRSKQPKGLVADTLREPNRKILEEAVQELDIR